MDSTRKTELERVARRIRRGILTATYHAKSGHPGGSLSIADLLTYLYWQELRIDPAQPRMTTRDRLVLSKGHAAPGLYAALAARGYFPEEELTRLRQVGALLQGHPDMKTIPGVDMSSGSLGQGISAAVGMALAGKMDGAPWRVYAIVGDGELQEGQVWEASMFAAAKGLDNFRVIVDNNNLQIDGTVEEVNSPYPIGEKFAAFGFHVIDGVDAHDFDALEAAFAQAGGVTGKPVAIVQKSVKGKGVSFMENLAKWHGSAPNQEQYETAMTELADI